MYRLGQGLYARVWARTFFVCAQRIRSTYIYFKKSEGGQGEERDRKRKLGPTEFDLPAVEKAAKSQTLGFAFSCRGGAKFGCGRGLASKIARRGAGVGGK